MVALAGCAGDGGQQAKRDAHSGTVTVASAAGEVALPFGAGDRIFEESGGTLELAEPASAVLLGTLAPVFVPNPADARLVAYHSWRRGRPTLRVHDARRGRDLLLAEGALSLAWQRDGRLAYFLAVEPDLGEPKHYLGHIVVRYWPQGTETRWTSSPGRYVVAAWAGRRLLVYRLRTGPPDLLVLEGARRMRLLARAGALVALSPDGRRALLARYGASPPAVRVVDVASGTEVARLTLPDVGSVSESGSWAGDRVAAATSDGIAIFRVREAGLELEQMLRFPPAEFPVPVSEPRLSESGDRVTVWVPLEPRPRQAVSAAVIVECDRFTLRCERSAEFPESPGPRPVYNPSRP